MKKRLLLIILSILAFIACRRMDDSSTVDNKPVNYEQNIDKTVKPGDNFFMYCNGTWWNKTNLGAKDIYGSFIEAGEVAAKRMAELNNESVVKFNKEVANIDNTTDAAIGFLKEHLKLVENITTIEQAHDAIIKTMLAGYDNIIYTNSYTTGRKNLIAITFSKNNFVHPTWATQSMSKLGISNPNENESAGSELLENLAKYQSSTNMSIRDLAEHPEIHDRLVYVNQTKSANNTLLSKVAQALGVDIANIKIETNMVGFFETLNNANPLAVKFLLQAYIADQYKLTSKSAYSDFIKTTLYYNTLEREIKDIKQQKMAYLNSYAYTKQYVTDERKAKMLTICEEMRSTFRSRIDQLDWMSEATKAKAREKLDAMVFNVGFPNKWIENALPQLKGKSLIEDIFTLAQSNVQLIKSIAKMPVEEGLFHQILGDSRMGIDIINANYELEFNAINIFPAWMIGPLYDENMSDACNYAIFSVVGHEITHGFDSEGAKYNKYGIKENWWEPSDLLEFQAKQQKLIDCYNSFEIMPNELPRVFADGKMTLDENIADLGGVAMAYQTYCNRLQAEGYKDEELKKQQIKFFQSIGSLWRHKYTPAFASEMLIEDSHSLSKERVNGVARNMDQWYNLYDVKSSDKLYLEPAKRTYIW